MRSASRLPPALLFLLAACEPLVLDVSAPQRVIDAAAAPAPDAAASADVGVACVPACVGGRRCELGACMPHWLPIHAGEVINDAPRVGHFSVWTGAEVLVWGGRPPGEVSGSYGDGIRFDPQAGLLRPMSRVAAPSARSQEGATAVWTGQEMLVLGGRDERGLLRDAAGYSPSLDRWRLLGPELQRRAPLTAVSTGSEVLVLGQGAAGLEALRLLGGGVTASATVPSALARAGHSALWTGAEVIVWGGAEGAVGVRADGYRYVPSRARWRAIRDAGPALARRGHSAVWSSSEMLVFGGVARDGRPFAAPVSYVPAMDAWRPLSALGAPSERSSHVAVWSGDAMIVWGGRGASSLHADGASYDPWDDAWTPMPPIPPSMLRDGSNGGRAGAAAVWTGVELIVLGGENGGARLDPFGWRYQP